LDEAGGDAHLRRNDRRQQGLRIKKGRLWPDVLGLSLVTHGSILQAITRDGRRLATPEQEEAEIQHLRQEIEIYRQRDMGGSSPSSEARSTTWFERFGIG
jgi:hypothetical protein